MLRIRKAVSGDEQAIAEVHVASWKTTYAGLIPDSFLENLTVEKRTAMWVGEIKQMNEGERQKAIFVCEDSNGKIQGFVSGGAEREAECGYDGEIYAIYLYKEQQGKGLGHSLTHRMTDWLSQRGYKNVRLWVLDDNPACSFYESIGGMRLPQSKRIDFSGKICLEVAYGWDSTAALRAYLAKKIRISPETSIPQ
jgi:L-amino acid N-acyltransferase YncA